MKAIIEPSEFMGYLAGNLPRELNGCHKAILCFDPRNFKFLIQAIPGNEIRGFGARAWLTENNVLICGRMGIGAPAATALLEELIACGIRVIISFGTAGALVNSLDPGTVALCTGAFVDEGTSHHYIPGASVVNPSEELTRKLEEFLAKNTNAHHRCKAWTTDAPFRETKDKLELFISKGAEVVEMEASALFNVAGFRGIDLAAVFVIGDSISEGVWKPYFKDELVMNRLNEIAMGLINFLSLIAHG